jgi:hypothetical protein
MESSSVLQRVSEAESTQILEQDRFRKEYPEEQYQKASKLKTINEFAVDLDRFLARTCDNTPPNAGQDKILPHGTSEFLGLLIRQNLGYRRRSASCQQRHAHKLKRTRSYLTPVGGSVKVGCVC